MLLHRKTLEITRLGKKSKSMNQFPALRGSQGSWQSSVETENLKHLTYYHTPVEVPRL